jgi:hypothetical protein
MHVGFGTFMNNHVQIWMFLFYFLTNTRYLEYHIMLCNIPLFLLIILILVIFHVVQKFKETLKSMLNMESLKKCMNILLLINAVFQF